MRNSYHCDIINYNAQGLSDSIMFITPKGPKNKYFKSQRESLYTSPWHPSSSNSVLIYGSFGIEDNAPIQQLMESSDQSESEPETVLLPRPAPVHRRRTNLA